MKKSLHNSISWVEDHVQTVKQKLEAFYADKLFPLDDRWELFVRAPMYLKNSHNYIYHFNSLDEEDIAYDSEFFHVERYADVSILDIAQRFLDVDWDKATQEERDNHESSGKAEYDFINPDLKAKYDAFREEVLEANIGFFNYDW